MRPLTPGDRTKQGIDIVFGGLTELLDVIETGAAPSAKSRAAQQNNSDNTEGTGATEAEKKGTGPNDP